MEWLSLLNPVNAYDAILDFIETGGNVLVLIMAATFLLWAFIVERYWYFATAHAGVVRRTEEAWSARGDHSSWYAHKIREQLISEVKTSAEQFMIPMAALVAVMPMFGLLGTVTGMIEVFDVMAATGSSNARAMASGVSKATIPTMAGMASTIPGVYFVTNLQRRASRETLRVADRLSLA